MREVHQAGFGPQFSEVQINTELHKVRTIRTYNSEEGGMALTVYQLIHIHSKSAVHVVKLLVRWSAMVAEIRRSACKPTLVP